MACGPFTALMQGGGVAACLATCLAALFCRHLRLRDRIAVTAFAARRLAVSHR